MEAVKGLENEPEKGKRCEVCFDKRFDVSAKKALELGEKKITTTLLIIEQMEGPKTKAELQKKNNFIVKTIVVVSMD